MVPSSFTVQAFRVDLTVNVCTVCKGVNGCCGGGAEGLELPAVCRGAVLCCPNCGRQRRTDCGIAKKDIIL